MGIVRGTRCEVRGTGIVRGAREKLVGNQEDVGDDEAQGEDLGRRQASLEQHLREDEGAAPDGYHDEGDEMVDQRATA